MGRLILPAGVPAFSKMIASIWFKPKIEAIIAANERWNYINTAMQSEDGLFERYYPGLVPIMEWGAPQDITTREGLQSRCCPSMIGLHCGGPVANGDAAEAQAYLYARFQYDSGGPVDGTEGAGQSGPDYYEIGGHTSGLLTTGIGTYQRIPVSAGQWHHVILSCDMTAGSGITFTYPSSVVLNNTCKVYLAFDDVNYNNKYLGPYNYATLGPPYWTNLTGDIDDPNSIFSSWALWSGGNFGPFPGQVNPVTTRCDAGEMPSTPFAIPCGDPTYSPNIEYGPCQVFLGEVLDTSIDANRRLFIKANGEPEDPTPVAELLGQPDVAFRAGTDWRTGTNVGSLGNFTPTGTILKTGPNPKLGT